MRLLTSIPKDWVSKNLCIIWLSLGMKWSQYAVIPFKLINPASICWSKSCKLVHDNSVSSVVIKFLSISKLSAAIHQFQTVQTLQEHNQWSFLFTACTKRIQQFHCCCHSTCHSMIGEYMVNQFLHWSAVNPPKWKLIFDGRRPIPSGIVNLLIIVSI